MATRQQPAFRVGVTGHRPDRLPVEHLGTLRTRLGDVLAGLDAALGPEGGSGAARGCSLVSALAEGTDRLAVDAAPRGWGLEALLPMPLALYRADFLAPGERRSASADAFDAYLARARSVTELPLLAPELRDEQRPAQYEALGRALVRQIDCLVAVWDGQPPHGPGGTAFVVALAVARGLPVVWIDLAGATREIRRFEEGDPARPDLGPADAAALEAIALRARRPRPEA